MTSSDKTPAPEMIDLKVSVVIATYNRTALLPNLLRSLAAQSLPPDRFELVLVDDGSREPAKAVLDANPTSFSSKLIEQENAGQAAARDRGVREATGDVVIILDDDMVLDEHLLQNHLAWHQKGYRVVFGLIASAQNIESLPLFERFHAQQLEKAAAAFRAGAKPRGTQLCTGNVSFRRQDYIDIGGFDRTLKRSEDRELGLRLEMNGAAIVFGYDAKTIHESDHVSRDVWLARAFNYGLYDHRIFEKHPNVPQANPWRFFFLVNPITRPFLLTATILPGSAGQLSRLAWKISELCDSLGLHQVALQGVTYVYGIEYFRGLRQQAGSIAECMRGLATCVLQRSTRAKVS